MFHRSPADRSSSAARSAVVGLFATPHAEPVVVGAGPERFPVRARVLEGLGHGDRLGEHLVCGHDIVRVLSAEAQTPAADGEEPASVGASFGSENLQNVPRRANRIRGPVGGPHQQEG